MSRRNILLLISALLLVAAAAGCARWPRIERITPTRFAPRPPDYPIALTHKDFDEPYSPIAVVATRPHEARLVDKAGQEELRAIARKLGGDAVVQIAYEGALDEDIGYHPGAFLRVGPRLEDKISLKGLVVRFDRP
ncbi:hypothetical protein HQ520_07100 [bacterium]|nr:hypothetical protein [bacterium]